MLIWRGWGIMVFVVMFGCLLIAQLATQQVMGEETYWQKHGWPFACGMFAAGAGVTVLERLLAKRKQRVLIVEKTGERIVHSAANDLFFIPLRYWSFIFGAIGVMVLLTGWAPGEPRRGKGSPDRSARVADVRE